ncbi:MAG: zf-HC2 domain-containing protein [Chloroflexota bacterium]|nr:zf-HC2 domain-containing protein [Chloroflexota bacterium]
MRCRDAKIWLAAQRDGDLTSSENAVLQEHLKHCPICRKYEQHQSHLDVLFSQVETKRPAQVSSSIPTLSTERIMLAVQQQKQITEQLEDISTQQRFRMARLRIVGPSLAAITFFTLGSIPLLFLALAIVQPDLMVKVLSLTGDITDMGIVLTQYLQSSMTLVTRNNWLLSGIALAFVVLMGMWLRLMRYPQEA